MKSLTIAVIGCLVLSAGCVRRQQFRYVQNQAECFSKASGDPIPGVPGENRPWPSLDCRQTLYTVGYIEFDQQGKAIDANQSAKALRLLEEARARTESGKIIAVVYVHGWKNNASEAAPGHKAKDVEKFHSALLELGHRSSQAAAKLPREASGQRVPAIPVVGVYMGWRGKSLMGPGWFTFLSYWGRRNAANRVGGGEDFATTLTRVIEKVNEGAHGSRVLLIGHSFGARVLEHAIEKRQVQLYKPATGSETMDPIVDLTLYVNSANDARLSMGRVQALTEKPVQVRHPDYDPAACTKQLNSQQCREYPLLVAITSRGDLATKYLLPTANTLNLDKSAPTPATPTGTFLDAIPPSGIYRRSAAPHMKFLQSHVVREVACPPAPRRTPESLTEETRDETVRRLVQREVASALGKAEELKALEEKEAEAKKLARRAEEDQFATAVEGMLRPVCADTDEHCRFVFRTQTQQPICFQVDQRSGVAAPDTPAGRREPFNRTAFWIMDIDKVVIDDHGDIWNLSFVEMLAQLMAPRGFFDPRAGRTQLRAAPATK